MEVLANSFKGSIEGIGSSITSAINSLNDTFSTAIDAAIDNVVSVITGFFDNFYILLQELLVFLFVPEDGFFEEKIDFLLSKFEFIDSILQTIQVFSNFFETHDFGIAPVVSIDLSSATGKYDYGNSAYVLDMTWYAPYKPIVDIVLESILWVVFVWRMFKELPNIINGIGSAGSASAKISKYEE